MAYRSSGRGAAGGFASAGPALDFAGAPEVPAGQSALVPGAAQGFEVVWSEVVLWVHFGTFGLLYAHRLLAILVS